MKKKIYLYSTTWKSTRWKAKCLKIIEIRNLPHGLGIGNGSTTCYVSPSKRDISLSCICIVAEELAEILANLHLSDRSERANFNGDVVGVICMAIILQSVFHYYLV